MTFPRPHRALSAIASTVLLLALAACGSSGTPAAAPPAPSTSPSPSPTHLDERAACALLTPAVQDATTVMKDFIDHPDGSTVDRQTLIGAIDVFQQVQTNGPPDLQHLVANTVDILIDLNSALTGQSNKPIETMTFTLTAQGILDQCATYS